MIAPVDELAIVRSLKKRVARLTARVEQLEWELRGATFGKTEAVRCARLWMGRAKRAGWKASTGRRP